MLEKTLESPLDCKESQPVHSEGVRAGKLIQTEGPYLFLSAKRLAAAMKLKDAYSLEGKL